MRPGFLLAGLAAGLFSLTTLPARAEEPTPAASPAPTAKPKRVCRREVETGTIIAKYTCHTKEEWVAIDAQNQANAQNALDNRRNSSGSGY